MRSRRVLTAVLGVSVALVASACGGGVNPSGGNAAGSAKAAAGAAPTLRIGDVTALTGPFADLGKDMELGLHIAVQNVNAAGGINGMKLKLYTLDDGNDPTRTPALVQRLANDDKVDMIIGPLSSGTSEVGYPVANKLHVPIMSNVAALPGLCSKNRPWTFCNAEIESNAIAVSWKYFYNKYHVHSVVVIYDSKQALSAGMATTFWPSFLKKKHIKLLGSVSYVAGTSDFSALITRIRALNPDGIIEQGSWQSAPSLLKQMKEMGLNKPILGTAQLLSWNVPKLSGKAGNGLLTDATFNPSSTNPGFLKFLKVWSQKVDSIGVAVPAPPDAYSIAAYDSINIIADIARKAGITAKTPLAVARKEIRDGLASLKDYHGIGGTESFGPTGRVQKQVYVLVIHNGKWVLAAS